MQNKFLVIENVIIIKDTAHLARLCKEENNRYCAYDSMQWFDVQLTEKGNFQVTWDTKPGYTTFDANLTGAVHIIKAINEGRLSCSDYIFCQSFSSKLPNNTKQGIFTIYKYFKKNN